MSLFQQLLFTLPPEKAHRLALQTLKCLQYLPTRSNGQAANNDRLSLFGLDFPNLIGVAAGFDKDAESYAALWQVGFGSVEVGTVTPRPQLGNPKPRLFRLVEDQSIINRLGFNNKGIDSMALRLAKTKRSQGILGINVGPNKTSADPVEDYTTCLMRLAPYADYFTINISSPNTPGLRELQRGQKLTQLLQGIVDVRKRIADEFEVSPPLLVKLAPDWDDDNDFYRLLDEGVKHAVDGFIISNTTVARPAHLQSRHSLEVGGLSGESLFIPSTVVLAKAYVHLRGEKPLVGVGGISDNNTVILKMKAGASLMQLYSGLIYKAGEFLTKPPKDRNVYGILDINASLLNSVVIGSGAEDMSDSINVEDAIQSQYEIGYI